MMELVWRPELGLHPGLPGLLKAGPATGLHSMVGSLSQVPGLRILPQVCSLFPTS